MGTRNKQQESAVQATEMRVLRKIVEKIKVDRVENVKLRVELKQGVLEKVRRSQLRRRDALKEMGPERLGKRVYKAEMEGIRRRGWPRIKEMD